MMEIKDVRDTLQKNPHGKVWGQRDLAQINRIILHQELGEGTTESVNNYHISDACHVSSGGTPKICYHFTIEKDGSVYWCNSLEEIVWHTKTQNTCGVGIMLVGDFDGENHVGKSVPTEEQEKSFYKLTRMLLSDLELPCSEVYGHCHFGKPACPGTVAEQWIENIRS